MRVLRFLLEKEFRQVFRDPAILRLMLIMPVIQLILLPLAANYEVKDVRLAVVDHDRSGFSRKMIEKVIASGYFQLTGYTSNYNDAMLLVEKDKADIIMEIPTKFEATLVREDVAPLMLSVNAVNGTRANIGAGYLTTILKDYNLQVRQQWLRLPRLPDRPQISVSSTNWFNPMMNYQKFMVPGILVILVTMVGSFLTALNIVKEKEVGTIEQINVTPIPKHIFILGKLIPFWIMGLIVLTLGLFIARVGYGIIPAGNAGLLYVFAAVFLLAVLGLGLLISTYAHTQQQAMLIAFFLMMIFILLSGLYTPVESMPGWAQIITRFNPVTYFIEVMRMVVMKGSSFSDISRHLGMVAIFAVVLNTWAVINYRKRA
ncbi:MAG TPA: ABC transporter permease [Phnomibacter sp.]|nr:ABC transporter permease [Phnomibacter sp.]